MLSGNSLARAPQPQHRAGPSSPHLLLRWKQATGRLALVCELIRKKRCKWTDSNGTVKVGVIGHTHISLFQELHHQPLSVLSLQPYPYKHPCLRSASPLKCLLGSGPSLSSITAARCSFRRHLSLLGKAWRAGLLMILGADHVSRPYVQKHCRVYQARTPRGSFLAPPLHCVPTMRQ